MDDDLEALRRRAFSRDGTAADLRMLADAAPAEALDVVEEPLPEPEAIEPEESGPDPEPARVSSRPRVRLVPLLAAALIGVVIGVVGSSAAQLAAADAAEREATAAALEVFDRPAVDPPSAPPVLIADLGSGKDEVRYLGMIETTFVYASLTGDTVCLALVAESAAGEGCTTLDDFRRRGLRVGNGDVEVSWGLRGGALEVTRD